MIYLDSVAIQAHSHGVSIYSAETLAQWIIQSWTGVGCLASELIYGTLYGTLLSRYMCRLTLAYYLGGDVDKAWDELVTVMDATSEVETDTQCPICFEEIGDGVQLKCQHGFHEECIQTWFMKKTTCPMCRYDIMNGVSQMPQ